MKGSEKSNLVFTICDTVCAGTVLLQAEVAGL